MEADRWGDLTEKLDRLAVVCQRREVTTLVLRDPVNLTWLLGCRVNVPQTLDAACLDVVVDHPPNGVRVTIVTNAIEAPRLQETELAGLDADWAVVPWWRSRDDELPRGEHVGVDRGLPDCVAVTDDLTLLRRHLTGAQRRLLRHVGRDTARAATAAAGRIKPSMSEYQAAGVLADELLSRELDPIVLLVGADARMAAHRHPLPTSNPLGDRAMLVACGRRHGLVASVTRIVSFQSLNPTEHDAYLRILEVERAFLDATRVGAALGDVVRLGVAAYAEQGFVPDEWHRHHQGGFSGFQPREFPAQPASAETIVEGAVVAWNPSGAGWKVEDTCLVLDDGADPVVHDERWPTVAIGSRLRPDVLVP